MIRFCDKEVCCVPENELNRQELLTYFMNGHRHDLVCVMEQSGEFVGMVTYASLLGKDIKEAVKTEYVILDGSIWEKGRRYFRDCERVFGEMLILPVLDREHRLLCFAWEDDDADRECRMLDELTQLQLRGCNVLNFRDVYPQFDCVTVHECNELAYLFVKYLEMIGVPVKVTGPLWEELQVLKKEEAPEYRTLTIYAEGIGIKEKATEWRKSVSVEFECIDRIYEENICKGVIGDSDGCFEDIVARISGRQIAILGSETAALDAYDMLLKYGLDICCFISDRANDAGRYLFGKRILKRKEAIKSVEDIIFLEAGCRYSAWGSGATDIFHYWGYKRNHRFFLMEDYIEISGAGYVNILRHVLTKTGKQVVLTGDSQLCLKMEKILERESGIYSRKIRYADVLKEHREREGADISEAGEKEIAKQDVCLLICPEYYGMMKSGERGSDSYKSIKRKYLSELKNRDITEVIDYPLENRAFMEETAWVENDIKSGFRVGKILIGSIQASSGNMLFRQLLDAHPDILIIDYGYLNDNLYSICLRLSEIKSRDILPLFWKMHEDEEAERNSDWEDNYPDKEKFNDCMKNMLAKKETFTSQELFVIIHIAYSRMWGKEIKDVSDMVIYWEPHFVPRNICESYAIWLEKACMTGMIINVVRNACIRAGSGLKNYEAIDYFSNGKMAVFSSVLEEPGCLEKEYRGWRRISARFEDLKCRPEKELYAFCDKLGIEWSDSLSRITQHGEQVYDCNEGFNLKPVYNTYEEYFSEYDRFRISLITGPWQKRYGYPWVSSLQFNRRELQEMFSKSFRFEKKLIYHSEEEKAEIRKRVRELIRYRLQMTRRMEILETRGTE